jgi:endonuclease G, mitochondrial
MNMNPKGWVRVRVAMQEAVRGWIYDPNVTLIDYGWPEHSGSLAKDELAIRLHVVNKLTPLALEAATREGLTRGPIPGTFAGILTDVRQIGVIRPQQWWGGRWQRPAEPRARRADPMQGGISISNAYTYGYGTLGGLVMDRETGARMMLSNWHVLAAQWHAQPGWPIYQPGRGDGGSQQDTVARLSHHAMSCGLDAAVAELTGSRELENDEFGLEPVRGVAWAQSGMEVIKSGRRTGITYGRVTGVEGTARLNYRGVYRLIRNVMTIEPRTAGGVVSAGGDSGSFWLEEETMQAVGLHFAGGDRPERALAVDMQPILDALNVDLVI